jgi:hypothetical protein
MVTVTHGLIVVYSGIKSRANPVHPLDVLPVSCNAGDPLDVLPMP